MCQGLVLPTPRDPSACSTPGAANTHEHLWPRTPEFSPQSHNFFHTSEMGCIAIEPEIAQIRRIQQTVAVLNRADDQEIHDHVFGTFTESINFIVPAVDGGVIELKSLNEVFMFHLRLKASIPDLKVSLEEVVSRKRTSWRASCSGTQRWPFIPALPVGARIKFSLEESFIDDSRFRPFWVRWSFCVLESATLPHNQIVGRFPVVVLSQGTEHSHPALNANTVCFATSAQALPSMETIRYTTGVSNGDQRFAGSHVLFANRRDIGGNASSRSSSCERAQVLPHGSASSDSVGSVAERSSAIDVTVTETGDVKAARLAQKYELHMRRECTPCAYFAFKADGCWKGDDCEYCHLCDKQQSRKREKERSKAFKKTQRKNVQNANC